MGLERFYNVGGFVDLLIFCNVFVVLYLILVLENCVFWNIFLKIMFFRVFEEYFGFIWVMIYGELIFLNFLESE